MCMLETNLSQIVKVVFAPGPAVSCLQTLRFVGDVAHVEPLTVEEFPFEQLRTQKHIHNKAVTSG